MSTVIDATGYQSTLYTLQEVTVNTMQDLLRELWQHDKADPERCYLSIRDYMRLCTEVNVTGSFKDFSPMHLSRLAKIASEATGAWLDLIVQETFSVGTLEFCYRVSEGSIHEQQTYTEETE